MHCLILLGHPICVGFQNSENISEVTLKLHNALSILLGHPICVGFKAQGSHTFHHAVLMNVTLRSGALAW